MKTVNIHEAKTHLSMLIDKAVNGEPFIIAKAGKPMVRVIPVEQVETPSPRIGFMAGEFTIPADFNERDSDLIADLFAGEP